MRFIATILLCLIAFMSPAEARQHHGDGRPSAWCGWWLSKHLGMNDRRLWLARNWASVGHAVSGPSPGVIGVQDHHVFKVLAVLGRGRVLAISGNDSHAVRTRARSTKGVFAWRQV